MTDGINPTDIRSCAERALEFWDVEVSSMAFVAARENAVFKVECTDGNRYALRIHRQGYHSLAELESENEWTTALSDAGIDTPRPVPTRAGNAYATVPYGTHGETRQVGMIEWIDGVPLDEVMQGSDPVPMYRELGALMARMHSQAMLWKPEPGFVRHSLDANGLVGDSPWWGQFWELPEMSAEQSAVVRAARVRLYRELEDYGTDRPTYSLIHADLLPQNVLVRDGRPFVIDFDDAGYGWHQYDMSVALRPFASSPLLGPCTDALVEGYRTIRPFRDHDLALLPTFQTIRLLVELGWLHTRVAEILQVSRDHQISRHDLMAPRIGLAVEACEALLAH